MATSPAIPTVQKAIVINSTGPNWSISVTSSHPVPSLQPNQALVRLTHSGVCHSDLSSIKGDWAACASCRVPGHEGVGRIVAYHASQQTASHALPKIGTKVGVPLVANPCGACDICVEDPDEGEVFCPHTRFRGVAEEGTFQQYVAVSSSYLCPVPAELQEGDERDAQIAPILCGGVTAYKALKKCGTLKKGAFVVVAGCGGGLGTLSTQFGVAMGYRMIGIDTGDEKRAKTLALGADAFVDFREVGPENVPKKILELTGGRGAHAVLVIAPSEATYNQAFEYVRVHGCVMCVGLPLEEARLRVAPGLIIHKDVVVRGSAVGTRRDIDESLEYMLKGLVKPDVVVRKMEDIHEIYAAMERHEVVGRIVLELR